MEKKRATMYIPTQNMKDCHPPMAENDLGFMDLGFQFSKRVPHSADITYFYNVAINKVVSAFFLD